MSATDVYAWRSPSDDLRHADQLVKYAHKVHARAPASDRLQVLLTSESLTLNALVYDDREVDLLIRILEINRQFLANRPVPPTLDTRP